MDAGRQWDLAPILRSGGTIIFPHASLTICGHQIAAAVHAALDCGAETVVAIGVLHALFDELKDARSRIADGGDLVNEPSWTIQGPNGVGREDWKREFSLSHFVFLWNFEIRRRQTKKPPRLILRYPHLAMGHPTNIPGYKELEEISREAAIICTMDPLHHGVGYGDDSKSAYQPDKIGLQMASERIMAGMNLLCNGEMLDYNQYCVETRSDGRDVGQVVSSLIKPRTAHLYDLVADDMTGPYSSPSPTWVAGALIGLSRKT